MRQAVLNAYKIAGDYNISGLQVRLGPIQRKKNMGCGAWCCLGRPTRYICPEWYIWCRPSADARLKKLWRGRGWGYLRKHGEQVTGHKTVREIVVLYNGKQEHVDHRPVNLLAIATKLVITAKHGTAGGAPNCYVQNLKLVQPKMVQPGGAQNCYVHHLKSTCKRFPRSPRRKLVTERKLRRGRSTLH